MNIIAISILYGITAFLVVITLGELRIARKKRLERKLKRLVIKPEEKKVTGRFSKSIENFLMGTGLKLSVEEFIFLILFLYIIMLIGLLISKIPIFIALLLSLILPALFLWYLKYKKEKRKEKVEKQMEGFLIDLSGILGPIPNILEALKQSIETLDQPLKDEILETVNDVISANLSVEDSLRNLSKRFDDSGLVNIFCVAMIQANKIGTKDTGRILKRYADIARRNQRIKTEAIAKLSYARTQKNILILGVILIYILVFIMNPGYINFYRTSLGLWIMAYSIISIGLGLYILNKLTNIGGSR